tara:strand:+ start:341 stop:523 length:183 start_codon:yes stop_codon:yes gene_type:complete
MSDFLEYDESSRTIKQINLDDFSIDELKLYLEELSKEIDRVNLEINKKKKLQKDADKFFK